MAPLIDIAGLRYTYPQGALPALDGVDLVLDGGLCLVAGPSGGGKSTLLRLFNGLVPHLHGGRISGRAGVAGHDVLRTPARQLATAVGFLFQDAERQAVHATVERDIAFGLENLGTAPALMRRLVGEVMERLAIAHLRGRTIAGLSGGERQRVAVAGALVLRPRMLVLDEPFSQLDAGGGRLLLELCLELRDAGITLVVSEHRLDDLLPAADSVVSISGGRLAGPCPPRELADRLDSAPQVVRLSRLMGWFPPLLDAASARPFLAPARYPFPAIPTPPVSTPPAWHLDGVTAGHDGLLRDVSAVGHRGEVVAVLGRNGSGKSTLLRVIAGLATPLTGSVTREPGRVAYLPQNPAALLHRESVAAEIAWTLRADRARGGPGDEEAAHDLLRTLGVEAIAACDPRDLSSGQRQRAAVAAILCGSPTVALLDEPTRGMDGAARDGLVTAMRALATSGAAVVVATHDSELAAAADRVLVIVDGAVQDRGSPVAALSGSGNEHATQLGSLSSSPGPVTVAAVAAQLTAAAAAGASVSR